MDPVVLAHQATDILAPALPFIYAERDVVTAKVHDMVLEKGIEKLGSKINKVKNLCNKIRSKGSEPIETALGELSKNSENQKAKEQLQQEISGLLKEDPNLAKEIEHIIININAENNDQVTIGNNTSPYYLKKNCDNTYVQINNYSDETKKETINQNSHNQRHYNPSTLPNYSDRSKSTCSDLEVYSNSWIDQDIFRPVIDAEQIFGREKELEDIENLLKDKSALVITGFRGTGKSTLASLFVDKMYKNGKFAGIYWRKVDETTDISDIIGSFFTAIGKSVTGLADYKTLDQINILFRELNESSYLLVLDNFESLLDPQTNKPLKSKIGFSELIESAAANCIKSKILFTSWESLTSERGISPFSYQIKGLDASAGVLLLRHQGLLNESEAELKEAIDLSGGHPLALILLVQLVTHGAGKLSEFLREDSLWIGEGGEVAENILNKVYTERLSEDERKILQYVSIFRQPVPAKAIAKIANDSFWTELRVKRIAWKLCLKSLLLKSGENYWEESLISKYVTSLLSKNPDPHKLAMNYYFSLSIPGKPTKKEDVQSLIEAHHHACVAEECDQAFDIIFDNNLYELLDIWGNYTLLIDLYSKLLPEDHLGEETLLEDKGKHGVILKNLGNSYYRLGNTRKTIEYYEKALVISREIGDRRDEGNNLGNLGNAYNDLGEPRKAIEYYEKALVIARDIGDRQREGIWLGNLGNAYRNLGDTRKAIEYYEKALVIARDIGDRRNEGIWLGNLGNAYNDLGEPRKAIEYYEKALVIARDIGDRRNEGNQFGNLGTAYYYLGNLRKAIEYHEQALVIARDIGDRRNEGNNLGNLGNAYNDLGEPRKAIEYYEKALVIARDIGDRRNEGIWLGNLGSAYRNLGDTRKAIEYHEHALVIARDIGDRRNRGIQFGKSISFSGNYLKAAQSISPAAAAAAAVVSAQVVVAAAAPVIVPLAVVGYGIKKLLED